jgi:hypothetical protein
LEDHTVATITSDHISRMPSDSIVSFDTIFAYVIPLVAMLTSTPLMWREERLWDFSVLFPIFLLKVYIMFYVAYIYIYIYIYIFMFVYHRHFAVDKLFNK